jgi:phosphatidylserine/phosphatidylglycerophosphate/cardiolipin synthase-like enzyme
MSAELSRLAPVGAPAPLAAARLEWLVDNASAYRELVRAIRGARRDIWISQLAFDADCIAYDVPDGERSGARRDVSLADELLDAARRGVQLRILLNASLLLDTAKSLREHFTGSEEALRCVRIRGVSRFPQLLHAKMLIADGEQAVLIGSPFANGYWDDARHLPVDARRPARELGGRPLHDLSTHITGPAVRRLAGTFVELWNHADDVVAGDDATLRLPLAQAPLTDDDDAPIRIVRTAPRHSTPRHRDGRVEILPALLDGIARARSTIYIEHQYLSARPIIAALSRALAREPALEIIVTINQNPDVTAYRGWQNSRLRDAGLLDHPRVGLFTLWSAERRVGSSTVRLNQVFVHSKLVAIDDRWATVGSANLDGVSLHSYGDDFTGALGRWVFRGVRNFDVNVVIEARDDEDAGAEMVRSLRTALWQEHLGLPRRALVGAPASGWLPVWRSRAAENVESLRTGLGTDLDGTFLLPYSTRSTPRDQLASIGVFLAQAQIELCFEPSWLEVHCSPTWVRNMVACMFA